MSNEVVLGDKTFVSYISERDILERVSFMAREIEENFVGKRPIYLVVLNGAFIFAADLLRAIDTDCDTIFVRLRSYDGMDRSDSVDQIIGIERAIEGRDVIIIEDIIDSGNTLNEFIPSLEKYKPNSVHVVTLLFKEKAFLHNYKIDYIGFKVDNLFVVGYGLDYDHMGRNLRGIYQLKKVHSSLL